MTLPLHGSFFLRADLAKLRPAYLKAKEKTGTGISLGHLEFNKMKVGLELAWISSYRLSPYRPYGKFVSIPDDEKVTAKVYLYTFPSGPGNISTSLFIQTDDGYLYTCYNIDRVSEIIGALEVQCLYKYKQEKVWDLEGDIRQFKRDQVAKSKVKLGAAR